MRDQLLKYQFKNTLLQKQLHLSSMAQQQQQQQTAANNNMAMAKIDEELDEMEFKAPLPVRMGGGRSSGGGGGGGSRPTSIPTRRTVDVGNGGLQNSMLSMVRSRTNPSGRLTRRGKPLLEPVGIRQQRTLTTVEWRRGDVLTTELIPQQQQQQHLNCDRIWSTTNQSKQHNECGIERGARGAQQSAPVTVSQYQQSGQSTAQSDVITADT